jgi:hypothetical protein
MCFPHQPRIDTIRPVRKRAREESGDTSDALVMLRRILLIGGEVGNHHWKAFGAEEGGSTKRWWRSRSVEEASVQPLHGRVKQLHSPERTGPFSPTGCLRSRFWEIRYDGTLIKMSSIGVEERRSRTVRRSPSPGTSEVPPPSSERRSMNTITSWASSNMDRITGSR